MAHGKIGRRVRGKNSPGRNHKVNGIKDLAIRGPVTVDSIQMNTRVHPHQLHADQDLTRHHGQGHLPK
eukprot:7395188-Prorocentrum_lima.AAC.1